MSLFTRFFQSRWVYLVVQTVTVVAIVVFGQPPVAQAGCGCSKLPPELAKVRPNATYAGRDVTLTHPNVQSGQSYDVTFTSGTTGASATVTTIAVTQRDLADSQEKPQVVASVPALPLGPTSISVSLSGQSGVVMAATDAAFTVAPQPLVFPETPGAASVPDYQAAVSRSGVVYISLDVTDMHLPRAFKAQAVGYPLRFTNDEVVFYNTQGFMMQLLDEGMPGLFAIETTTGSADSDTLQYSRHEFNTHFLQHEERQSHEVDASDPNWHADGTPHITHDHLIIALSGMLDDGSLPLPGATPLFDLAVATFTLFQHGLAGNEVELRNEVLVDSYTAATESYGADGTVFSNTKLNIQDNVVVAGNTTSATLSLSSKASITGEQTVGADAVEFLAVEMPTGLENLGSVKIEDTDVLTLGPGSYQLEELKVDDEGTLHIENGDGPVTLYLTGGVSVRNQGAITVSDPDPEKLALYVMGSHKVEFRNDGVFTGVIYAPASDLEIRNNGEFFGSFVGHKVVLRNAARIHYETDLRGE